MSAERHHEHESRHAEQLAELAAERDSQIEKLRTEQPEKTAESSTERAEHAREVIHAAEHAHKPAEHEARPQPHIRHLLNPKLNYAQTLASVQRKLKPVSRSFSKFIHQPLVERTSDAVGSTVARPSVAAGSTWTALLVGGLFYLAASRYGYRLSGAEMLVALLIGALLGLALEGAWRALKRR